MTRRELVLQTFVCIEENDKGEGDNDGVSGRVRITSTMVPSPLSVFFCVDRGPETLASISGQEHGR